MAEHTQDGSRAGEEDASEEGWLHAEAILRTMRQPLVVLNGGLRVETANHAWRPCLHLRIA